MARLGDLESRFAGREADIEPPSAQPGARRGKYYNIPPRYYRCADESVPWGWRVMLLPGDPENFMHYVDERGFVPLSKVEGKMLMEEQIALTTDLAKRIAEQRAEEERLKGSTAVIIQADTALSGAKARVVTAARAARASAARGDGDNA